MVNRADLKEPSVSRFSDDDIRDVAEACGHKVDRVLLREALDRVLSRYQIAAGIDHLPSTRQINKALKDINVAATKLCKKLDDLAPPLRIVVLDRLTLVANAEAVSRGIRDVVQVYGGEHIEVAGGDFLLNEAVRSVRFLQELSAVPKVEAAASTKEVSEPSAYELLIGKDLPEIYHKFSGRVFRISKSADDGTVGGPATIFIQACMKPFRPMTPAAIETHWDNYRRRHGRLGTKK